MISMKLTAAEAKEYGGVCSPSDPGDLPAYPYGLSLSLCDESLNKLGMKTAPAVGSRFMLQAIVEVTGTNVREEQKGKDTDVSLQITDMSLEMGNSAEAQAAKLYPTK